MKGKFRFFIPWPVVLLWLFLPSSLHAADSLKVAAIFPRDRTGGGSFRSTAGILGHPAGNKRAE